MASPSLTSPSRKPRDAKAKPFAAPSLKILRLGFFRLQTLGSQSLAAPSPKFGFTHFQALGAQGLGPLPWVLGSQGSASPSPKPQAKASPQTPRAQWGSPSSYWEPQGSIDSLGHTGLYPGLEMPARDRKSSTRSQKYVPKTKNVRPKAASGAQGK